jgi:lauroyl/myristoyl acyltransferase
VQTGAALMPAALWYEGDEWGVRIHEEIPVPDSGDRRQKAAAMTQQVAAFFEEQVRQHPADWHMLQRVFVADLDPQRLAAARARLASREQRAASKNSAASNGTDQITGTDQYSEAEQAGTAGASREASGP